MWPKKVKGYLPSPSQRKVAGFLKGNEAPEPRAQKTYFRQQNSNGLLRILENPLSVVPEAKGTFHKNIPSPASDLARNPI